MRVPLSWLKEYVDINISPEELGEMLTMSGLEVEALDFLGKGLENIVVGQILNINDHPDADRLKLCFVTDGNDNFDIVCGATNMKVGDKVALAKTGIILPPTNKSPEGLTIKKAKIRGVTSEGMLCSENELGLSDESDGIMILPETCPLGVSLIDAMDIEDVVLELGVTPNRPDCLSVLGICREIAAILDEKFKMPVVKVNEIGNDIKDTIKVQIQDQKGCQRYSCRVVEGVKIGPSPSWLKNRLESAGVRSINNIVDVTNYVMLEYGQPLHGFDLDLLSGKKIVVRSAKKGEKIITLDGVERKLENSDLLICDSKGAVALAGVMGGADTEVSTNTNNLLLESAYFDPIRVRKTSKRTGLRSESSYRFERGVDPNGVTKALDRAASLIAELSGGYVSKGIEDVYPDKIEKAEVTVSVDKINSVLGTNLTSDEVLDILKSIDFQILKQLGSEITVRVPTFRVDIFRDIDLIEEIGRLFGYNNIPVVSPSIMMITGHIENESEVKIKIRDQFISTGFLEAINYSFENSELLNLFDRNSEKVALLNPLTAESSTMRTTLLMGLLRNTKLNLSRQIGDVRLFEFGRVFFNKGSGQLPREITKFAAIATGSRQPEVWNSEEFDFFDLKGVIERVLHALSLNSGLHYSDGANMDFLHPGSSSKILLNHEEIGFIGELHPDYSEKFEINKKVFLLELGLNFIVDKYSELKTHFKPLPKYPSIKRDISLIVEEGVSVADILERMRDVSSLIEDAWVFDVFKGNSLDKGKKSVAISMLLRDKDKTLTDEEANEIQNKALNNLQELLGAELRTI